MQIDEIFHEALKRGTASERAAYLDGACAGDPELRERADALLASHEEAEGFLEEPALAGAGEDGEGGGELGVRPGERIGSYKILQTIGEGGMGIVYMAEQEEPVRRKVALKIIKLGMDTRRVIARFEAERQALALMDHPNIAKVLDAGATETGRPYFVMELVRGVPITEYCDTNQLPTVERLRLFLAVCRAIHHAHQKGVIHRDIKPSNVLVTLHDGVPVPKIIDFGIAKATNQRLTEKTLFTEFRQFIGTPEYMSPEQAEMSGLDVDTRADIYSLGVLLYQLLTGTTPVDAQTLLEAGWGELQRLIREKETPSMSARVSQMGAAVTAVAKHRKVEPGALIRELRGDLDWVVMKALEKDRTRRYETAIDLAADIERHLSDEPVQAGPPSAIYKLRKFVRRHRVPVVAAASIAAALVLGLGAAVTGFLQAREEARRNQAISDTLIDLLGSLDPSQAGALGADVSSVLAKAREVFGDDHATVGATLGSLAAQLFNAGDFEAAEALYRESLGIWQRVYGERHANVGFTQSRLGELLRQTGRNAEAEETLRSALAILEGFSDPPTLAMCDVRDQLADLLSNKGHYDEAIELYEASIEDLRADTADQRFRTWKTLERLSIALVNTGRKEELVQVARERHDDSQVLYPPDSPFVALTAVELGCHLFDAGKLEEAETYLREAVRLFRAHEHMQIYELGALDRLFQLIRRRDDPEGMAEADEVLAQAIEAARPYWEPERLLENLAFLAVRLADRELFFEALEPLIEAHAHAAEAGMSLDQREGLRDKLAILAFRLALVGGSPMEVYERGLAAVEASLAGEPEHLAFLTTRAGLLVRLDRLEEAASAFEALPPSLGDVAQGVATMVVPADHGFRALLHGKKGEADQARRELELFRELVPQATGNREEPMLRFLAEVEAATQGPNR